MIAAVQRLVNAKSMFLFVSAHGATCTWFYEKVPFSLLAFLDGSVFATHSLLISCYTPSKPATKSVSYKTVVVLCTCRPIVIPAHPSSVPTTICLAAVVLPTMAIVPPCPDLPCEVVYITRGCRRRCWKTQPLEPTKRQAGCWPSQPPCTPAIQPRTIDVGVRHSTN